MYQPTKEEIEKACVAIQENWRPAIEKRRRVVKCDPVEVDTVTIWTGDEITEDD